MDPLAFVADRLKDFSRSTEKFVNELLQRCQKCASQRPIEILKRLQREAFSDLMKLRERQDKLERLISFYKSGKGGPFQEPRTHMKGIINADGAFMFLENNHQQGLDNLDRVGRRNGIDLRFIFDTSIGQRDLLIAEFLASHCTIFSHSNNNGSSPLALSKLVYLANFCDSLSAVFVPLGAKCTEFGTTRSQQGAYESIPSSFSPPLFHQSESCGLGFIVKGSNLAASLAGLASRSSEETGFAGGDLEPSIFAQVSYKPSEESRHTMSVMWQTCKPSQVPKLSPMAAPVISKGSESVALMVESRFDESNNVGCWVEMSKCSPSLSEWGVSLSDVGRDEVGWGLRLGGRNEGSFNQIWLEGFLSFSLGKKAVLQPGIFYAVGGECRTPAVLLRSSWFM